MCTEVILTSAARDEELLAAHSMPRSSSAATKRLASSSRELGILGLPPEKMALVREKKDDIEKVTCSVVCLTFTRRKVV